MNRKSAELRLIVGVGASAGGLDAFRALLTAIDGESSMAFVLVQHLSPEHDSLLPDLLAKHAELPVHRPEDGAPLQPGHVYVIEPNTEIAIEEGRFRIEAPTLRRGVRLPVDHLFMSLARLGNRAAGIVLSGTGRDGSAGVRCLREAGGLTIVQRPDTAGSSGMPQSAIDSGAADLVLPIADMPAALDRFARLTDAAERRLRSRGRSDGDGLPPGDGEPGQSSDIGLDADVLGRLAEALAGVADVDPRIFKTATLDRRLSRRMLLSGTGELGEYLSRLEVDAAEREALSRDLLIGVTDFFRDRSAFDALRPEIARMSARLAPHEPFRCWVAGCATGEEAYSIAIEILDAVDATPPFPRVQLFATDVDPEALEVARTGTYSSAALEARVSPRRLARYFAPLPGRGYRIQPLVRELRAKIVEQQRTHDDLENFFSSSAMPILIFDESLLLEQFTPAASDLLGLSHADEGRPLASVLRDSLGDDLEQTARATLEEGELQPRQLRLQSGRHVRRRVVPYRTKQGAVAGVVVTLADVTDLVEALERSAYSEERLRLAKESARLGLYDYDPVRQLIEWDDVCNGIWGTSPQQAVTFEDFAAGLHPDDVAATNAAVEAALEPGGDGRYSASYRVRNARDGGTRWVHAEGQVFFERGRAVRMVGLVRDVTAQHATERSLRDAEERLRLTIEAGNIGIFDLDVAADENRWSPELKSLFGLPPDADLSQRPSQLGLFHPEDAARAREAMAHWREPGRVTDRQEEFRIVRADDGKTRWLEVRAVPIVEGEGEERRVVRILGAAIDVTDRKQAEIAVRESEERMRRLFDQAPALIAIHEGKDHRYIYSNPPHDRAVGGRPLVGRPLREAMAELEGQDIFERFDQVFRTGKTVVLPLFSADLDLDGSGVARRRSFSQVLEPWFDSEGNPAGVMSFAFDVTVMVDLRAQVAESEVRFRNLADHIDQLVWMASGAGDSFWFNKRWFDYTGTGPESAEDGGWRRACHPDHVNRVVAKFERALQSGERWEDEYPLRSATGDYRWFLARTLPLRDENGDVVRWFGTHTDVTDHRRAESRLRMADRRKDEFLAMLGHELRNPLSAIVNAAHILSGEPAPNLVERVASVLTRQARHMSRLIDGLLEVSRVTRGKLDIDKENVELRELVELAVSDRRPDAKKAGVALTLSLPEDPVWVQGDIVRLTQVIDNLLGNAIKFTDRGGHVNTDLTTSPDLVTLVVSDDGVGLSRDLTDQIFEPFQQAKQDIARSAGGLGLGLALARGIVDLHDGRIFARSPGLGLGASFHVELPRGERRASEHRHARTEPTVARTVLVVEDSPDTAEMLMMLLRMWGHSATWCANATDALSHLDDHEVDVALCDVGLPDMSGFDLCREIRARPDGNSVFVVAVTGYGQSGDRAESQAAGFDAHLTKPVDVEQLQAVLRQGRDERVPST